MMTVNEIIEALDYCANHNRTCRDCPYAGKFSAPNCEKQLHIDALKYIKCQRAEIKRQQAEIELLGRKIEELHRDVISAEHYAWKMREAKYRFEME